MIIFEALMHSVVRLPHFQYKLSKKYLTMKQIILFFMLLFVVFSLSAYDYQTVYSKRTALFADSTGAIKSMFIDSVKFNVDSILYPLKNIQQLDVDCFTPYGASWLGNKIIVNAHWNYFFNEQNDTIKIKTDAKLNETWMVYQKNDTWVWATVTKVESLTFLGLTDSVKTIVFNAIITTSNSSAQKSNSLSTELDGKTLLLSKHFGLINTFDFFVFPLQNSTMQYVSFVWDNYTLAGLTNPNVGVQNLTWFDVYDFQPGDEIHTLFIKYYSYDGSLTTKTITKYIERENLTDTIKYLLENKIAVIYQYRDSVSPPRYFQDTTRSIILKSDRSANFDKLPGVPFLEGDNRSAYTMGMKNDEKYEDSDLYDEFNNGCWKLQTTNPLYSRIYKKGLGGPYGKPFILIDIEERVIDHRVDLVYYKKGSTTWGTPLIISGIDQPEVKPDIAVYPNPATDKISISSDFLSEPCIFELMDVRGIVILRTQVDATRNTVNLSNFSKGLYLYRLLDNGKSVKAGKIVKS